MVKVSTILFRGSDSLWYISNERGRRVSTPIAPVAACAKGNLLLSSSSGKWSETITSINPSLIPLTRDNLSSSSLRGGDSFKKVLNSPISFSFNDKLFIETPTLNFLPLFLFFLITSKDCLDEIWFMWYLQGYSLSKLKSLSIIIFSASDDTPCSPSLVAISPSLIQAFFDNS